MEVKKPKQSGRFSLEDALAGVIPSRLSQT